MGPQKAVDREFVYIELFALPPETQREDAERHSAGLLPPSWLHLGPILDHDSPSWLILAPQRLPKASPKPPQKCVGSPRAPRANSAFFEHPMIGCTQGDFCTTSDFEHPNIGCTQGDFCKIEKTTSQKPCQVCQNGKMTSQKCWKVCENATSIVTTLEPYGFRCPEMQYVCHLFFAFALTLDSYGFLFSPEREQIGARQ